MIDKIDGKFFLTGICEEGGARLINPELSTALFDCKPNPASAIVMFDFEIADNGHTELFISDLLGKIVSNVFETDNHGKYSIEYDLSRLNSGIYVYMLQTPTTRFSKLMEVVK